VKTEERSVEDTSAGETSAEETSAKETERIEVNLVLEAIHAKYGYDLRGYTPEPMHRLVRALVARTGLAHLGELQHRLLHEPEFFASVMHNLTVQVSSIFRDPSFYRTLRERVVPVLRTYPEIRVWHAGCSSGEEVYATAILFAEEELTERTRVVATDLSSVALQRAKEGVYSDRQLAAFTKDYQASGGKGQFQDYCRAAYGRVAIRQSLRQNILFFQHNLVCDYAPGAMHVIFCRNVLIYFGSDLREHVLGTLGKGLIRGGFLCLGASEALPDQQAPVFTAFDALARIYRRTGQPALEGAG
jgi:chemotaxis protein methyltransferase CheR